MTTRTCAVADEAITLEEYRQMSDVEVGLLRTGQWASTWGAEPTVEVEGRHLRRPRPGRRCPGERDVDETEEGRVAG